MFLYLPDFHCREYLDKLDRSSPDMQAKANETAGNRQAPFQLREMFRVDSGIDYDLQSQVEKKKGVLMMSFSMRKLVGFRQRLEYDARVLIICT